MTTPIINSGIGLVAVIAGMITFALLEVGLLLSALVLCWALWVLH